MNITVASRQIQGKRDYQQDAFGQRDIPLDHKLLFLADGMGGYKGGEKASELVIQTFMNETPSTRKTGEFLSELLDKANKEIALYKKSNPDVSSMGTTLVALFIIKNRYQWISVGDSPLYLIRDNTINRINKNHSVGGLLELQFKNGEITQEELDLNPNKHMLISAITGDDLSIIDLSKQLNTKQNDIFILASDGVETLSEKDILSLVNSADGDMDIAVENILSAIESKNRRNQDNVTVMIISIH